MTHVRRKHNANVNSEGSNIALGLDMVSFGHLSSWCL
jgi:hypothetical protein